MDGRVVHQLLSYRDVPDAATNYKYRMRRVHTTVVLYPKKLETPKTLKAYVQCETYCRDDLCEFSIITLTNNGFHQIFPVASRHLCVLVCALRINYYTDIIVKTYFNFNTIFILQYKIILKTFWIYKNLKIFTLIMYLTITYKLRRSLTEHRRNKVRSLTDKRDPAHGKRTR